MVASPLRVAVPPFVPRGDRAAGTAAMAVGFGISQGRRVNLGSLAADVLLKPWTISPLSAFCAFSRCRFLSRNGSLVHPFHTSVRTHFQRLSRHAAVWKRLLRRLNLPLPTFRVPFRAALSAAQTERLIRRAIPSNVTVHVRPYAPGVVLDSYDN